jgi:hypothetical protein
VRILLSSLLIAGSVVAVPAIAQSQPQSQQQQVTKVADADQVICEKQEETGSRLSAHKVCHTRSQWDQMRRDDRSATEHVQEQRAMGTPR